MIQEGLIEAKKVLYAALTFFALGGLIGLYLNYIFQGNVILILGIIGVFLGFFYTADPLRIGYTGFGELVVGIGFGPLVVIGSYYVQAHKLSWEPFWASIPVAILIASVLYINEFPDYEADKAVNKKTLVVILGKEKALKIYYLLLLITYSSILLGIMFEMFPLFTLITFLTLPLCFKAIKAAKDNFDKVFDLLPANAATIGLHLSIGLLLTAGYALDKLIR